MPASPNCRPFWCSAKPAAPKPVPWCKCGRRTRNCWPARSTKRTAFCPPPPPISGSPSARCFVEMAGKLLGDSDSLEPAASAVCVRPKPPSCWAPPKRCRAPSWSAWTPKPCSRPAPIHWPPRAQNCAPQLGRNLAAVGHQSAGVCALHPHRPPSFLHRILQQAERTRRPARILGATLPFVESRARAFTPKQETARLNGAFEASFPRARQRPPRLSAARKRAPTNSPAFTNFRANSARSAGRWCASWWRCAGPAS